MSGIIRALEAISSKKEDLFALEVKGIEIIFRLPSIHEAAKYSHLLSLADTEPLQNIVHEHIFRSVVTDDHLANHNTDMPAGIPSTIARLVLFLSGADENNPEYTRELINLYRGEASNTEIYIKRTICQVFPGYTFDSLDEINFQSLINIFIQAEKVLLDRGIIEKEHNFDSPKKAKPKPYTVEDVINKDRRAYEDFNRPEDPAALARAAEIREKAIKRAQQQEKDFRKRIKR